MSRFSLHFDQLRMSIIVSIDCKKSSPMAYLSVGIRIYIQNAVRNCTALGKWHSRFLLGSITLTNHRELDRFTVPGTNSRLMSGPYVQLAFIS